MATMCTDEVILKDAIVELKGVNWFSLGIQLDIEKCELDKMKSKHPHDENLCMIEVLDYWLKNTSDPTWHNLADAVEKVGGHSKVVENLRARQELNVSDDRSSEGYASTPSSVSDISSDDESASGYQVEPWKGCGCGKCNLYTLCQRPCPNPDSANLFRIWNGTENELSLLQKEREVQYKQETCRILRLFATLIKNARGYFKNEIPVREVLEWLMDAHLDLIVKEFRASTQDNLHQVDQYQKLFSIFRDYWSWYNYDLLKDLIKAFGDNKLKRDLRDYKRDRKDYFKKRTLLAPYLTFGDDSKKESKVLLVKVDEEWGKIPLAWIQTLHYKIATILHVQMHTLYLSSVSKGCIQLKFFCLHSDADQVIQLSSSKKEELQKNKIIEIKYRNESIFCSSSTDLKPQLHHWTSSEHSSATEEDYSENKSEVMNESAIEGLPKETDQWGVSESDGKKPSQHVSESENSEDIIEKRIATHRKDIEQHVNLSELSMYLDQEGLLDHEENEHILSEASDREKVSRVLDSLKEKPNGFTKFLKCVKRETNHMGHLYIASLLEGKPFALEYELKGRIEKTLVRLKEGVDLSPASDETRNELVPFTPSKRALLWLEMDGPFKGKGYLRLMRICYRHHHSGQHDALIGEAQKIMSCNSYPPEFQALVRVELALSCTFRGKNERALELIEGSGGALSICEKIPGNNAAFLIGRCMHLLSGLYRYAKQHDKAKEYATKAMVALHGVAPGQESSIANYMNACLFLESSDGTPSDVRIIEQHFRSAIDHAHQSEIATYVILPQSHIRLAQLYLGSTQYHHGTTTNPENIKKARDSLNAVNFDFISQRSKSLYYMAESDCYRAEGDIPAATNRANLARSIAEGIQFTLGVNSAESRLTSLLEMPTVPADRVSQ